MTTKDYTLLAQAIKDLGVSNSTCHSSTYRLGTDDGICMVVDSLCEALKQDNPRFHKPTFLRACHLTKERVDVCSQKA